MTRFNLYLYFKLTVSRLTNEMCLFVYAQCTQTIFQSDMICLCVSERFRNRIIPPPTNKSIETRSINLIDRNRKLIIYNFIIPIKIALFSFYLFSGQILNWIAIKSIFAKLCNTHPRTHMRLMRNSTQRFMQIAWFYHSSHKINYTKITLILSVNARNEYSTIYCNCIIEYPGHFSDLNNKHRSVYSHILNCLF